MARSLPILSVIIPTYKSKELLNKYLLHNHSVLQGELNQDFEIIISDDNSLDGTMEFIEGLELSNIQFVVNIGERGFGGNCNNGVKFANADTLFFLNSDIKLEAGFLKSLLVALKLPNVFSVVPKIIRPLEQNFNESITSANLKYYGIEFDHKNSLEKPEDKNQKVLWCCGAAFICKKNQFLEIGGFGSDYSPYYIEDVDLSMKAWRLGLENWYIADSNVFHFHNSTIKANESEKKVRKIFNRNRYLFVFHHFSSYDSLLFLIVLIISHMLLFHIEELLFMSRAFLRKKTSKLDYCFTGKQILNMIEDEEN